MQAVFFDLDGTIYYGDSLIDGANDTILFYRNNKCKVFFVTNNSTKTREQIFNKLKKIGVSCKVDEVITSGYVAALYMKQKNIDNVYVCGSEDLKTECRENGITVVEACDAENMLIGYNPQITYEDITIAMNIAFSAKNIIACNKERNFPGQNAKLKPGCGAMVASIEWCANRQVDYIVGKPNTLMLKVLCEHYSLSAKDIVVIGDTYSSDIAMAKNFGCKSVLIGKEQHLDTICVETIRDIIKMELI